MISLTHCFSPLASLSHHPASGTIFSMRSAACPSFCGIPAQLCCCFCLSDCPLHLVHSCLSSHQGVVLLRSLPLIQKIGFFDYRRVWQILFISLATLCQLVVVVWNGGVRKMLRYHPSSMGRKCHYYSLVTVSALGMYMPFCRVATVHWNSVY